MFLNLPWRIISNTRLGGSHDNKPAEFSIIIVQVEEEGKKIVLSALVYTFCFK
jgi:hypothetical protein